MAGNTGPNDFRILRDRRDCAAIASELLGIHAGSDVLGELFEMQLSIDQKAIIHLNLPQRGFSLHEK